MYILSLYLQRKHVATFREEVFEKESNDTSSIKDLFLATVFKIQALKAHVTKIENVRKFV